MDSVAAAFSQEERPESKVEELTRRIRNLAYERGANAKLPTARELYKMFETNWVILNGALEALEQQNVIVRKQGRGIFVSEKLHRKTIGVLIGSGALPNTYASPFWGLLFETFFQEINRRSQEQNEYYSLHLTMPRFGQQGFILPEDVVNMIKTKRMHAIIGIQVDVSVTHDIHSQGIPYIAFAGYSPYMVALDRAQMIQDGIAYLQAKGCQRIGLWSAFAVEQLNIESLAKDHVDLLRERLDASYKEPLGWFGDALRSRGLSFVPELVRNYPLLVLQTGANFQRLPLQEQGYRIAMDVFGNPLNSKPDGVVITDDMLTSGALQALQHLGIKPGEHLHIATHANAGSPVLLHQAQGEIALLEFETDELIIALFTLLDELLQEQVPSQPYIDIKPRLRVIG